METATKDAAAAAHSSHLFRIRRTFALDAPGDHAPADAGPRIVAMAAHSLERRQLLALAVASSPHADDPRANYLLVRSVEEDRRVRHWRFPLAVSHAKQQQQRVEPVAALCFGPEGDWLACLSTRKNRLHLVPVATLIAGHRRTQLQRAYQPPHNREWMGASPSVMTTPMASYLRATNQAGGLNGARYHSRVAGDNAQMSTLEFAVGMGTVTCCRWWRSMNGKNYCLVGGSENIISIVNVEDNAEECRCELQNAGRIESIELFYETFRKEKRTSMLVKTKAREAEATTKKGPGEEPMTTKYYRVVLEKRTIEKKPKQQQPVGSQATPSTGEDAASTASTQDEPSPASSFTRYITRPSSAGETYIIKTFPEHFVEDMDFRPQRIKKNRPDVRLSAINGLLSSESGLAMYDASSQQVSVYSNFQWSLKGQYMVPSIAINSTGDEEAGRVGDVDIAYCSTDLMLLQGKNNATGEFVSTWVSLPSRQGYGDDQGPTQDEAHAVHYLSLHDNERVESVLQTRSGTQSTPETSAGEVIYVIQTAHNVYECRPQWSRLALFRALRSRTIALRDALSIGYALGIDMPSLCEVVADTLCDEYLTSSESIEVVDRDTIRRWVHDLFEVSRAAPSKAVEQLSRIAASTLAIEYAKRVLTESSSVANEEAAPLASGGSRGVESISVEERQVVSLQVVDLILKEQAQYSFSADSEDQLTLRPRDPVTELQLTQNESWLGRFLRAARTDAFNTGEMIDLCLSRHQTEKAAAVAIARDTVQLLLQRVVSAGQVSTFALPSGKQAVQSLLDAGYASYLLQPMHRLLLRSLSSETQLDVLLASSSLSTILLQRDWILRHLGEFSTDSCVELALLLDPQATADEDDDREVNPSNEDGNPGGDVASSEFMELDDSERVELFLTLLLRINSGCGADADESTLPARFSQASLEMLLRELAFQYRPPIMIARCVDYENWSAAASLHEAHGELVDAVECRLHSHDKVIQRHRGNAGSRRRKSSKESLAEEEEEDTEKDDQDATEPMSGEVEEGDEQLLPLRKELLGMIDALVIRTPAFSHTLPVKSTPIVTTTTRAAILARVLVKWFEYGLTRAALEIYLIDSKVFADIAAPLAQIFFSEIVDRVGVKGLHPSTATASADPSTGSFDERDKAWVRRCHTLPFSGQFLFHVCMWLLDHHQSRPVVSGSTPNTMIPELAPPPHLLHVVKENIEKNDLAIRAVRIEPQSAQAIGKSDPLETHVKAFSCGHLFPKRVFDEDVLPEFEKRMNALPTPLFATKQLLMSEFKRSHVEAPCPVCAFNKISTTVFHQLQSKDVSGSSESRTPADSALSTPHPPQSPALYFLHRSSLGPPTTTPSPFASSPKNQRKTLRRQHDDWEWSTSTTATAAR